MPLEDIDNIVIPSGSGATTCGYCSPPGQRSEFATSYHSATLEAIKLTCAVRIFPGKLAFLTSKAGLSSYD
ncbi:hypothetical protein CVT26_007081 [Gymnopilus dilepis]|uniref:Uncharacterized protein n=1 Tax=Gymnopilus dilepis TaxID=231916 RepID=A0A409VNJ6_9AGAR|nr:hypothetical protein CVT26_007081 [Gymnopilus dilepis]